MGYEGESGDLGRCGSYYTLSHKKRMEKMLVKVKKHIVGWVLLYITHKYTRIRAEKKWRNGLI